MSPEGCPSASPGEVALEPPPDACSVEGEVGFCRWGLAEGGLAPRALHSYAPEWRILRPQSGPPSPPRSGCQALETLRRLARASPSGSPPLSPCPHSAVWHPGCMPSAQPGPDRGVGGGEREVVFSSHSRGDYVIFIFIFQALPSPPSSSFS